MKYAVANNARTKLRAPLLAGSSIAKVESLDLFPLQTDPYLLSINDEIMVAFPHDDPTDGPVFEITERGMEGTSPANHVIGNTVENRFTAGTYQGLLEEIGAGGGGSSGEPIEIHEKASYSTVGWYGNITTEGLQEIFLNGVTNQRFSIKENSVIGFTIEVVGVPFHDNGMYPPVKFKIEGVLNRQVNDTPSICYQKKVAYSTYGVLEEDDSMWQEIILDVELSTAGSDLILKVSGASAYTSVSCTARGEFTEVIV